jgi:hypothetical protein
MAGLVPAIHVLPHGKKEDLDARDKTAHDDISQLATNSTEIGVSLNTPAAVSPKKS